MKNGFTLTEAILYTVLLGFLAAAFVSLALLLSAASAKALLAEGVLSDTRAADAFIARELRSAETILSPAGGNSSSSLEYIYYNGDSGRISLLDGRIKYSVNNSAWDSITSAKTAVSRLDFTNLNSGNIEFEISAGGPADLPGAMNYLIELSSDINLRR